MKAIWIEFAASDIHRANTFYAAVFGHRTVEVISDDTREIIVIPGDPTVSLNRTEGYLPEGNGTLPYFDVDGPLGAALGRVVAAGGSISEATTERPGSGFFALIADSEGNHLYLHSMNR